MLHVGLRFANPTYGVLLDPEVATYFNALFLHPFPPEPLTEGPAPRHGRRRGTRAVTVHFIGAGPGDPDLITVRGRRLIEASPVVLYAGSLVPPEVIACAPEGARVLDTAPMTLDEIVDEMRAAHTAGHDVARVHSGDPSLYGAIGEQMRRLDALGIPYDVTPGVPAYAAAAAALERELTLPGVSQTVILTRTSTRSSPMPEGEELEALARSGATLAIHLSVRSVGAVCDDARPRVRRGLPGRRGAPRVVARRAHRHRHPHRPRGEGAPPPPPAHRPHPRRPRPRRPDLRRQRPLQRRPPPPPPPPEAEAPNALIRVTVPGRRARIGQRLGPGRLQRPGSLRSSQFLKAGSWMKDTRRLPGRRAGASNGHRWLRTCLVGPRRSLAGTIPRATPRAPAPAASTT